MIDIHTHLLPGVDDGAADLEESLGLCRAAVGEGCTDLVVTPHQLHPIYWNEDRSHLEERFEALTEALEAELGGELTLHLGAEIHAASPAHGGPDLVAELERWPAGDLLPLAGSRWLLVEFDRIHPHPDPGGLVHELRVAGWRPIVAHPEVLHWLAEDLATLERLVDLGAALQLTAASVSGAWGRRSHRRAKALLDADLVHFVASDSHNLTHRPPDLGQAADALARGWGEETARRLTRENPRAVLEDRPLPESMERPTREASSDAPEPAFEPVPARRNGAL